MTQEIRHTQRPYNNSEVLYSGEIAYLDSNTIKIGDGLHTFAELPTFSSNTSSVDTYTTSVNAENKIQAVGTKNKNTSDSCPIVVDWVGSADEYTTQKEAGKIQSDWMCFITDDLSGTTSSMYTKAEIDAFLSDKADGQGGAVMLTGAQTVEGNKTFLNNVGIKSTTLDVTTTPTETKYTPTECDYDKNGQLIGYNSSFQTTSNAIGHRFGIHRKVNNVDKYDEIQILMDDSGNSYTHAPNPSSVTDNSNKIATTHHVIEILKTIYPVGAIYIGTQSTCPMASFFGTWSLVSSGKALWTGTGSNGNSTIAAGLPNITGSFQANVTGAYSASGAFTTSGSWNCGHSWDGAGSGGTYSFSASNSSSIYGNSTTVQPPAYVVNVWRRTA